MKNRVGEKNINKIIMAIILILVIGTPLLYARFVYNPWFISTMKITFIQVLVIIAASLYLLTEGRYKLVKSGLNYPVIAFIIACSISLFSSVDIYISVRSLFSIILLAGLYVLVSNVVRERKQIRRIMFSLIFVSGFISIYGIVQYLGTDLLSLKVVGSGSISGPFENRNVLASFLVFTMPVSAGFLFEKISKKLKIMVSLVGIITLIALIYTRTRGAWVGFMGAMAFFAGAKLMAEAGMKKIFKSLFSKKSLIIVSLMVICLGLLIRYDYKKQRHSFIKKFLSIANLKDPATRHRFVMWHTGIDIIKEHPLLGTGMGTFKKIHLKYQSKYFKTKKYGRFKGLSKFVHNDYLEITTNTGILGLGTFLWLIVTLYWTGLKRLKQISESKYSPNLLIIILSSLTAVLIHSFFHYSFYLPATSMLFWLWLGLLNTGGTKLEKTKENIRPSIIRQGAIVLMTILLLLWVTKPFIASLYFNRAGYYTRSGHYDKAIATYKKSIEFNPRDGKARNNLGNVYRDIGLYGEALKEYDRALKINPYSVEAHNNLGILYVKRGLYGEAIKEYVLAIEINPNLAGVHNNLGNTYRKKGLYDKALKEYQEATNLDRRFVEAYNNLGVTLAEMGELNDAVRQFSIALQHKPNYEQARSNLKKVKDILNQKRHLARVHNNLGNTYRKKGLYGKALKEYREAIAINPSFAEAHNNLGVTLVDMGELGEAVEQFSRVLRVNPKYERARSNLEKVRKILITERHNNLGNTYRKKGLYGKALKEYREAIAINPSFAEAHNNLGVTLVDMGELGRAVRKFKKALRINPKYEEARSNLKKVEDILKQKRHLAKTHNNLGNTYRKKGLYDKALKEYQEAVNLDRRFAQAYNNLGVTLVDMGKLGRAVPQFKKALLINPKYEEARSNLKKVEDMLKQKPHLAEMHNNLGNTYRKKGLYKKALKEYKEAINLNPSFAEAYNNLGVTLIDMGELGRAVPQFKKALLINPKYEEARSNLKKVEDILEQKRPLAKTHNNLGNTYRKNGLYKKALKEYKEAINLNPSFAEAHNNLGVTLVDMGKLGKAVRQFEKALRINPKYEEARSNLKKVEDILKQKLPLAKTHNNLGNTYRKKGLYKKALKEYQEAINLNPSFAEAYNNLGVTFTDMGKLERAVRKFKKALRINPKYEEARSNLKKAEDMLKQKPHLAEMHNNLGNTYRKKGLYKKALKEYKKAINLDPFFAEAHNNIGVTFADMGKLEKAVRQFKEALRINPKYEEARSNLEKVREILRQK